MPRRRVVLSNMTHGPSDSIYILCCRSDISRTWIRYLEIFIHWFCPVGKWLQSRCQDDVSSCVAPFTGQGTPCLLHQWHV
jgi:hypothetical protein